LSRHSRYNSIGVFIFFTCSPLSIQPTKKDYLKQQPHTPLKRNKPFLKFLEINKLIMLTRTTTALLYTRQVRHFGVKLSASNFIQKELRENPEFFNAFPHLAARKGEQA